MQRSANQKKIPRRLRAEFDFVGETQEELDFHVGDILDVVEKVNEEWFYAKDSRTGRKGMVPANHVELLYDDDRIGPDPALSKRATVFNPGRPDFMYDGIGKGVAMYNYQAMQRDELSIQEGDQLVILNTPEPEWLMVRSERTGKTGLVPGNYVQTLGAGKSGSGGAGGDSDKSGEPVYSAPIVTWEKPVDMSYATQPALGADLACDARVLSYEKRPDRQYQFVLEVYLDSGPVSLIRSYEDFYNFQLSLLESLPEEAGQRSRPRILPFLPGQKAIVTEAITQQRCVELDQYVIQLFRLPDYICKCQLVQSFFAPASFTSASAASQPAPKFGGMSKIPGKPTPSPNNSSSNSNYSNSNYNNNSNGNVLPYGGPPQPSIAPQPSSSLGTRGGLPDSSTMMNLKNNLKPVQIRDNNSSFPTQAPPTSGMKGAFGNAVPVPIAPKPFSTPTAPPMSTARKPSLNDSNSRGRLSDDTGKFGAVNGDEASLHSGHSSSEFIRSRANTAPPTSKPGNFGGNRSDGGSTDDVSSDGGAPNGEGDDGVRNKIKNLNNVFGGGASSGNVGNSSVISSNSNLSASTTAVQKKPLPVAPAKFGGNSNFSDNNNNNNNNNRFNNDDASAPTARGKVDTSIQSRMQIIEADKPRPPNAVGNRPNALDNNNSFSSNNASTFVPPTFPKPPTSNPAAISNRPPIVKSSEFGGGSNPMLSRSGTDSVDLNVKVIYETTNLLIKVSRQSTFEDFRSKIVAKLRNTGAAINNASFVYTDEDGDRISVQGDDDLHLAFEINGGQKVVMYAQAC